MGILDTKWPERSERRKGSAWDLVSEQRSSGSSSSSNSSNSNKMISKRLTIEPARAQSPSFAARDLSSFLPSQTPTTSTNDNPLVPSAYSKHIQSTLKAHSKHTQRTSKETSKEHPKKRPKSKRGERGQKAGPQRTLGIAYTKLPSGLPEPPLSAGVRVVRNSSVDVASAVRRRCRVV